MVGQVGRAPPCQPREEAREGRGLGGRRREERIPRAALGDVQRLTTGREGGVEVQEGEKVGKDEGETLEERR